MGVLHQGVCYPTAELARAEVCSNANLVTLSGQDVYASACTSSDFSQSSYTLAVSVNGAVVNTHQLDYPEFTPCDHTYSVGLIGAWLAAALLLAATLWGMRKLIELFSGRLDE